ncbi:Autoinducer 2 sensor kinase/phosphatase LuxQ [Salinivirga cyanobacteriivorans]|uniref:histidine kinase n=1 Tax=Salinivirga cyanobacteriivorans TaxID=1307839 RepID=A0A0S2HVR2_9BACT|nr:PAS domain S-box protein [Salinivirga cyanobacteriivorans]ALO14044.1 Autoinducer 2 sensor kinase/phosphatase LuxQ [Salinivirga cyanobacteriivorans]
MQQCSFENIPDSFLKKWQEIADLLATIIQVPAALIMKAENEFMEVFTSSNTENNPYNIGDKKHWHSLYCETVIKTQKKLNIPNALKDKDWDKNPDIKLGMIAYLGFPINYPDKTPFGTICVLDNKERPFSAQEEKLLNQFKNTIELDLALISGLELEKNSNQKEIIENLLSSNEEYLTTNEELQQTNEELLHAKQRAEISEEKLRKKNELLEKVLDSSFDLIALSDLKGYFTLVGKSYEILGYSNNYLIGKNILDFVHPDETDTISKKFTRFLQTGENRKVEYRHKCSNGDYLWFESIGSVLKDEEGKPEQLLFNSRDITERKKADEALRESETRFQKMLGVVPDMVSIQNPEMDILYSNWKGFAAVEKRKQILKTKCYKTYRNLNHICPDCHAKTVFETRKPVHDEVRLPDGKWYDIRVIPILDENNNVEMFMEWVRDITDSKQAEETLKSNYALLQIAGETARFGGWSVNLESNTATWSDAVADIHEVPHGYAPPVEDAINFYAPEWRDKITQVFNNCAQKGIPYDEEMEIITAKGNRLWVRANGKAIKDETGKVVKVQGAFQDISERKKAEKALRESEEKMRSIYRVAPTGIGVVVNRELKEVNPRVCHMTGYSREELINKNAQILYPSRKEYDFVGKEKYEQIRKKGTGKVETLWRKKDGTIINVLLASTPIDQNDHSKGVTFTALDITDRKKAEGALKESEERFRYVLRDIPWIAVQGYRFDGTVIYWNKASENLYGYKAEEAMGGSLYELIIPPEMREIVLGEVKQMHETLKPVPSAELSLMRKNGSRVSVISSHTIVQRKGHEPELFCLDIDITDRKRAEMIRQLQYNITRATITTKKLDELFVSIQNELNSIIDARNFVIAFYNKETGMLSANVEKDEKDEIPSWPAEKSLTGYVIQENRTVLLQKDEILRLHEAGTIDLIGTTAETWLGVPLKIEERILGAVVVQNYDNTAVYDQSSVEIMELVAHELSMFIDRQRSEDEVTKLSRAVEQSSVSVVITNREGAIEYVNPFFTELTGYSFEEAMGKNPNILKSGHHNTAFYKELWDTILSGKNWEGEILNKKKNGDSYWEKAVISPVENNAGIVTNFVAIKENITGQKKVEKLLHERNERIRAQNKDYEAINEELRQANEELLEAKEKAEESDRLKTAFLQNMSHEIRTPLNAISGFSGMLNKPELNDVKRQKFVSIIQNSSRQLVAIISDILTISALDTKQEKLNISKVNINDVIEELFSIFKPGAEKQNIALKTKKPLSNGQSVIYTDKTKITQIFTNLLSNALKFTHEGSVLMGYAVKTDSEPAEIEFYVKDSGIGMTPNQQKIIFERFQQAHKSINKLYGGTGLGLSISKGFAEMMGGKIWVESKPNKGSTFYFTIPFKPVNKTDKATSSSVQNAGPGTILVAEDEELNFVLIEEYLTTLNVNLIHAKDGQETVDICKKNPDINLVLMDIKMPKITGDEAAKIIKQLKPSLPIVAQSAYVQEHDIDRFSDIFDAYLAKPITEEVLKQTVNKFITISKE